MMRIRRSPALIASLAVAVVASVPASTAMAGDGFGPKKVLRIAPAGREIHVSDLATKGRNVAAVWQEQDEADGADPRIRYRISTDGGATFQPQELLDPREHMEARADICGGMLWVASTFRRGGDPADVWNITLDGRDLDGSVTSGSLLTFDDPNAHLPDVACVGSRRLIVGWVEEEGVTDAIHIRLRKPFESIGDPDPPVFEYDFGPFAGNLHGGVAVAASGTHAFAAWTRLNPDTGDQRVRFKRFTVGPGDDAVVTGFPVQDPVPFGRVRDVHAAALGSTVILAYLRHRDVWVSRSTDNGVTFDAPVRAIDTPQVMLSNLINIDLRGSRAVVEALLVYGDLGGGFIDRTRGQSFDGGATWQHEMSYGPNGPGSRAGAFTRARGNTRLVEMWDDHFEDPANHKLRFHRET
jgi:hypothetical protein